MSFKVESDNLRRQAKIWSDRKDDADTVGSDIDFAVGKGDDFGVMAGGEGVSEMYDEWISDMSNALKDAAYSFAYLNSALTSTANDYDETDATAATDLTTLDNMIKEQDYHHD
jgi:uncharacterized protein YukE